MCVCACVYAYVCICVCVSVCAYARTYCNLFPICLHESLLRLHITCIYD